MSAIPGQEVPSAVTGPENAASERRRAVQDMGGQRFSGRPIDGCSNEQAGGRTIPSRGRLSRLPAGTSASKPFTGGGVGPHDPTDQEATQNSPKPNDSHGLSERPTENVRRCEAVRAQAPSETHSHRRARAVPCREGVQTGNFPVSSRGARRIPSEKEHPFTRTRHTKARPAKRLRPPCRQRPRSRESWHLWP